MREEVAHILFSTEDIQKKIKELGARISSDYQGKNLILIGVLKGAMFFMADLMRQVSIPVIIDFIGISSYGESSKSSGAVRIIKDIEENIDNKPVLVVEDIVDTGLTMNYLLKTLRLRKPSSIKICVLIDKKGRRMQNIPLDYVGFEVENQHVVGFGLDYRDRYRHLPYLCTLKESLPQVRIP
ncbi:MAG: hypoxanthine phosphoribosyltransferase [Candidatus Eremiobacteraeota bacterium]|nr:hypoxanthine phosphoribosyltransferase [Candidatus Eremiobacteraeota bacterium]